MDFPAFSVFPVETTFIFPYVNSDSGGQLLSEYNLRSRESVATDPNVTYIIGPSYTHSLRDFEVTGQGGTALNISAGMALVNGHKIDAQVPVTIDLAEYNINHTDLPLRGALSIGLKAFYSTSGATAGALLGGTSIDGCFYGIQVVILPQGDFKTPSDSPNDASAVTAHLKLADFSFVNGVIGTIVNNSAKIQMITGDRISGTTADLDSKYASVMGLNGQNFYVMGGNKWCSANESIMKWDSNTVPVAMDNPPTRTEAAFVSDAFNNVVKLVVPHKQIDGLKDDQDHNLYIPDREIPIPVASYDSKTPGIVDSNYTQKMHDAIDQLNNIYKTVIGKQVWYLDELSFVNGSDTIKDLPKIQDTWEVGDYIVVRQDNTVITYGADTSQPPSTMYIIIPNYGNSVQEPTNTLPSGSLLGSAVISTDPIILNTDYMASKVFGVSNWRGQAGKDYFEYDTQLYSYDAIETSTTFESNRYFERQDKLVSEVIDDISSSFLPPQFTSGTYYTSPGDTDPIDSKPGDWDVNYGNYYVADYVVLMVEPDDWNDGDGYYSRGDLQTTHYYYTVIANPSKVYSDAIYLTGSIPYAQEDLIGGFKNVSESETGMGYVIRDEEGHLRLLDYGLLSLGLGAYQLGEDFESPAGLSSEEVQNNLYEWVNDRIAFPNAAQVANALTNSTDPNIINITLNLSKESEATTITVGNIDSRFGASVYLHILGDADANTTINVVNCEKIRIDSQFSGPTVNIYNCNLYYDSYILGYANEIENLKLWYEPTDTYSSNIVVNGLTVSRMGFPQSSFNEISFGNNASDNHIRYALHSITFDSNANIVGMSIFFGSDITIEDINAIDDTKHYFYTAEFSLEPDIVFGFPMSKLTKQIKISGIYTSAYADGTSGYITTDLNFSALTPTFNDVELSGGTIAIRVDAIYVPASQSNTISDIDSSTVISGMQPGTYQVYEGYLYGQFSA